MLVVKCELLLVQKHDFKKGMYDKYCWCGIHSEILLLWYHFFQTTWCSVNIVNVSHVCGTNAYIARSLLLFASSVWHCHAWEIYELMCFTYHENTSTSNVCFFLFLFLLFLMFSSMVDVIFITWTCSISFILSLKSVIKFDSYCINI